MWLKEKTPIILGATGIILLLTAFLLEYIKANQKASVENFTATESASFSRKIIKVDIEGAVQQPGIYEIPNDSRIQDVLIAAGGMTAKADRIRVSKDINLAQLVFDGQKIYIPEVGLVANPNLTNINLATETELDTLSGIGPVTAKKIIAGRPYQTISELLDKHLVSASVYEKIKDSISVN